ncbi:uncharacterized protein MONOS_2902 [Monocercomonoides exilis]|uniref:uncharacterized protein n=1 Tax=Monocercomonoides exilis TaxID=2049356 RepID=UPI003559C1B6|nr:hypothetical protein MONOS_2902 [Monocercomonoides exilis]|eukprot:MONOS_2902.1-p1 / transcript=MONOS_2902.1 / gene=MONOS_2902 / organism=Monocercomonoides_exilis_PA203 / gene_product=unspecified product / transcript_product=unspecified product / location=Mono_scaffold00063:104478-113466(-) / protein_length=2969 / sequence_SO=supercontig / SO=protein_coding / is_pseudo=false
MKFIMCFGMLVYLCTAEDCKNIFSEESLPRKQSNINEYCLAESFMSASFSLQNASTQICFTTLVVAGKESLFRISPNSFASASSCAVDVMCKTDDSPILSIDGNVQLCNVSFNLRQHAQQFPLLASSLSHEHLALSNKLSIVSCTFADFVHLSVPFLSPSIAHVSVEGTTFRNVSSSALHSRQALCALSQACSFESCLFAFACDVFDGGITQSINSEHMPRLYFLNNSFSLCLRTSNVNINGSEGNPQKPSRQTSLSSGMNTFAWCEWTDSTGDRGGAISIKTSAVELTVNFCTFISCHASEYGGAIYTTSNSYLSVANSSFVKCEATSFDGGGLYTQNVSNYCLVSDCFFMECNSTYSGGGLHVRLQTPISFLEGAEKSEYTVINNCSFITCSVTQRTGGGLAFLASPNVYTVAKSCIFFKCTASFQGGGLSLELHFVKEGSQKLCSFFLFQKCSCSSSNSQGHDVFINDPNNKILDSPFFQCYTSNPSEQRVCWCTSNNGFSYKKDWLLDGLTLFASSGGLLVEYCGLQRTSACKTIDYTLNTRLDGMASCRLVLLASSFDAQSIEASNRDIAISGEDKSNTILSTTSVTGSSLFKAANGHLEASSFSIEHLNQRRDVSLFAVSRGGVLDLNDILIAPSTDHTLSTPFTASLLVSGTGGIATLSGISAEGFFLSGVSVFSFDSSAVSENEEQKLTLDACTFCEVKRSGGEGGGVIGWQMGRQDILAINNCTFRDCETGNGSGGAINIEVSATSELRIGNESNTLFESCSASEELVAKGKGGGIFLCVGSKSTGILLKELNFLNCRAWKGSKFFMDVPDIHTTLESDCLQFEIPQGESTEEEFMGFEGGNRDYPIPLWFFLVDVTFLTYIGGVNSFDFDVCGYCNYPCSTIAFATSKRSDFVKQTFVLKGGFRWKEFLVLKDAEWHIYCEAASTEIEIGVEEANESNSLVKTMAKTLMSNISFVIPSSLGSSTESLLTCTQSELSLENCSFFANANSNNKIGFCVMRGAGGKISLEGVTFKDISLEMKQLLDFDASGGSEIELKMGTCSFENTTTNLESGLVQIRNIGKLSVDNSTFCRSEEPTCALFEVSEVNVLHLENSTFSGVSRGAGNGGVISGRVCEGDLMNISDCSFLSNNITEGGMKGGSLFVAVEGSGSFVFDNNTVSESKVSAENGFGGGLFAILEATNCVYSLKNVMFLENGAKKGRNLYLVCPTPRFVVEPGLFAGSAEKEMGEADMWVFDDASTHKVDESMRKYLFVYDEETMYVDTELGARMERCGTEVLPCLTMDEGFGKMAAVQTRMHIVRSVVVESEIKRIGLSLRIQGCEEKSELVVKENGHFEQTNGASDLCIVFSKISFELPGVSNNPELITIGCGELDIIDCIFDGFSEAVPVLVTNLLIIQSAGGSTHVDRAEMRNLHFEGNGGLCCAQGGSLLMEETNVRGINGTKSGAIKAERMNSMMLSTVSFEECTSAVCSDVEVTNCLKAEINNCTIKGCVGEKGDGGFMSCLMEGRDELKIFNSSMNGCNAKEDGAKGGGMFLDFSDDSENCYLLEKVSFDSNVASVGKNIFMKASDLNVTVKNRAFDFEYSSMKDDENAFVGSDLAFEEVSLLVFLIEYSSWSVHISSTGHDVAGCGSEKIPCGSFWKGVEHADNSGQVGEMIIEGTAELQESYDLSDFVVRSEQDEEAEMKHGILLFKNKIAEDGKAYFENEKKLTFQMMNFTIDGSANGRMLLIESGKGSICITLCSLLSIAASSSLCKDIMFLHMKSGSLNVSGLYIEVSRMKSNVMDVASICQCNIVNVSVFSIVMEDGSVIAMEEPLQSEGNRESYLKLRDSSIQRVTRLAGGASVLTVPTTLTTDVEINNSVLEVCAAGASAKGGAVFADLSKESMIRVMNSKVIQCGCSVTMGRGGGLYLALKYSGELGMLFERDEFDSNSGKEGRDIFIECWNISRQINETLFKLDLRESEFVRYNAIFGVDSESSEAVDLIDFILIYQSETIVVSSIEGKEGKDIKKCGTAKDPCHSIEYGVTHLAVSDNLRIRLDGAGEIGSELDLKNVCIVSKSKEPAKVRFSGLSGGSRSWVIEAQQFVELELLSFEFTSSFPSFHLHLMKLCSGSVSIQTCSFSPKEGIEYSTVPSLLLCETGLLEIYRLLVSNLKLDSVIEYSGGSVVGERIEANNITLVSGSAICEANSANHQENDQENDQENGDGDGRNISVSLSQFCNITQTSEKPSVFSVKCKGIAVRMLNCSYSSCSSLKRTGSIIFVSSSKDCCLESCALSGFAADEESDSANTKYEEICKWNGSVVDFSNTTAHIRYTTIVNASSGGMTIYGGNTTIEKGEFAGNGASIAEYRSARRNIACSGGDTLNIVSLKGGDGVKDNTSLWILDGGCALSGIAGERESPFFLPTLDSVAVEEEAGGEKEKTKLTFKGTLLLPCNLSFRIVVANNDSELIETYQFHQEGYINESSAAGLISSSTISKASEESSVECFILFGKPDKPCSTNHIVVKNKSMIESKGDDRIVEGGREGKSSWALIVIVIFAVLFLIVLVASIVATIRWRRAKEEAKKYKEIVDDTIKKDPKAFEMVTMEMSPEEQWRRAEREVEKKNDERMKKRIYGTNMEHSESSEHLLSESGSTEYILGRDSDKIPQWMLEKVEEEEIRKRTPSPSISSTSTTSTTDSDSTFVRREDLCPTTSSMSNLVDAMACSSPHEKLIVDLRDSLFMLLHGRNEKKEMAIGTLKEREMTAAQILFWVANLALHSFDKMDNPLQTLSSLSPHIVLFSEHMVICIVMHSDFLSDEDSDSSSISSSTVVTSTSDDDDDSLPSSAFEDEDDNRKEYLRWMAPELLDGTKKHATKKTVAFSIGMMLWECLTLIIPFGEYEAVIAGDKITKGERPPIFVSNNPEIIEVIEKCLSQQKNERPTLIFLKREFIQRFPKGATIVTVSDAIDEEHASEGERSEGSTISEMVSW